MAISIMNCGTVENHGHCIFCCTRRPFIPHSNLNFLVCIFIHQSKLCFNYRHCGFRTLTSTSKPLRGATIISRLLSWVIDHTLEIYVSQPHHMHLVKTMWNCSSKQHLIWKLLEMFEVLLQVETNDTTLIMNTNLYVH